MARQQQQEEERKVTTEVFLPLIYKTYKENKVNLLKTNLLTLKSLERIKKIQELNKIKKEQRKLLRKLIKDIKQTHKKIQKLLPSDNEIKLSSKIKKNIKTDISYKTKATPFNPNSRIDEELIKIQERLKTLTL